MDGEPGGRPVYRAGAEFIKKKRLAYLYSANLSKKVLRPFVD
jgi:hypothetical protein